MMHPVIWVLMWLGGTKHKRMVEWTCQLSRNTHEFRSFTSHQVPPLGHHSLHCLLSLVCGICQRGKPWLDSVAGGLSKVFRAHPRYLVPCNSWRWSVSLRSVWVFILSRSIIPGEAKNLSYRVGASQVSKGKTVPSAVFPSSLMIVRYYDPPPLFILLFSSCPARVCQW